MKVQVFAMLKEYFDGQFEIDAAPDTISALKDRLVTINPGAEGILSVSRFAVHDEFVESEYLLTESDTVFIIPPSSGG